MMLRCGEYIVLLILLNIAWWYGMLQYTRSVRVEYVSSTNIICNDLIYRSL